MAGLFGAKPVTVSNKKIILVGASHMRRTATYMESTGASVQVVETAHWRATSREVLKLLEEIKSAMVDNT
jgi:hypothetical protein